MNKKVVVIGGGLGSLSGAIRLAKMGFEVELFEQNSRLGGKMDEIAMGGYRFDTGPSLLTMDFVVDDLFNFAGYDRNDFLDFSVVDPICRYFFPDGSILDASSGREKMVKSIDNMAEGEGQNYIEFLNYCKQIYDLTADIFLFTPIHEIKKLIAHGDIKTLFQLYKIDPFRSVHKSVSSFFNDKRLIQLFDRYATYNGSNPFKAPATLNIISYVEYGLGGYYIRGGMYRLVNALERIANDLHVKIRKSLKVDKILWDKKQVNGVMVNGKRIFSDYILCGADVVVAHDLLIDGLPSQRKKLNKQEPSISGIVFLLGVGKKNPELKHHNIIFSSDYEKEFKQIFDEKRPPDDPTIYISITSKADPEHAPKHGENWFVLLNMPYISKGKESIWDIEVKRLREIVISKLKNVGIDISNSIEFEQVHTPITYLNHYSSNRGSIYGISSNSRNSAFRRSPNRSKDIKGLYFAGGSVHPGGGIPLVLSSGKLSAELIAEAEKNP